jgi:hypothetical protein
MTDARNLTAHQSEKAETTVQRLVALATRGLVPMFNEQKQMFCYSLKKTEQGMVQEGLSPRYTMMTLMGLQRLEEAGGGSPIDIKAVLQTLLANLDWITDIGDLGVLLWTCALIAPDRLAEVEDRIEIETALRLYPSAKQRVTMELAWFLTGLSNWAITCPNKLPRLRNLAFDTFALLKKNRGEQGFFGHLARSGSVKGVARGRIGSFADQVYPVYAMTRFSQAYQEESALQMALQCGRGLCEAQGQLGQWWWHYDSLAGKVAEGYPVFSVHQHAMGPMTLFAVGEAGDYNFDNWIYKGLRWINLSNELNFEMEDASNGVIWRCIQRSHRSLSKYLKAGFGRYSETVQHDRPEDLEVLFECRPYELGWLLYAFANRAEKASSTCANK